MSDSPYGPRTTHHRFSRRKALRGAALGGAGLASAALLGCGSDDEPPASSGTSAPAATGASGAGAAAGTDAMSPRPGQVYVNATIPTFTYQHLDPHPAVWTSYFTSATHNLLANLDTSNRERAAWTITPDLADSWETPDDVTFVFHLLPARFHDAAPVNGRQITSEDAKFSFERISTEKPQFFRQHEFRDATIETPDDLTIVLTFPRPQAAFWNRVTTPGTVVLPVEVADTEGELIRSGKPVAGTGPFMHEEFVENETFKLKRNPNYFKADRPYLDGIEGVPIVGADAQLVAFRAGQLDVVALPRVEDLEQAREIEGVTVDSRFGLQSHWIVFHTEKEPYGDVRVRKAISLAHPRREIVDIAMRGEEIGRMLGPGGLNPETHGAATYSWEELAARPGYRAGAEREQDVAEAKKLLSAAGFTGLETELKYTQHLSAWPWNDSLATILTDAMREIGFDLTLVPFSYGDTLVNLANRDFALYHTPQYANSVDPNEYLEFYFLPDSVRNYGAWLNSSYVELMEKQNTTIDPNERNAVIREIVALLEEEVPRAPTVIGASNLAVQPWLHNFHNTYVSNQHQYDQIWRNQS